MTDQSFQAEYNKLQKQLKKSKISDYNYSGERTLVIIAGMNSDSFSLKNVKGLHYYEERMLFFLFLLRYSKTKIVYITSEGFNEHLFDYYISLTAKDEGKIKDMRSRLIHIEIPDSKEDLPLTKQILDNPRIINQITSSINNPNTAVLRCYNPTIMERKLSVKLNIPLFAPRAEFEFAGTKSGSRKIFKLAKVNQIPGCSNLKNFSELSLAMAKLMKNYPYYKKLVIKLDQSASGRGNSIFDVKEFLKTNHIEINVHTDVKKLATIIRKKMNEYLSFQMPNQNFTEYMKQFDKGGGIVELYIPGDIKYSPSTRILVTSQGEPKVLSAHEQILGGPDKQKYLGSSFPCMESHRKLIINESKKIAKYMANKGILGNFSVDFVIVYNAKKEVKKVYAIEINLRKIGSTNPFVTAHYLTNARYSSRDGQMHWRDKTIHYVSMDFIESEKYKNISSIKLVDLIKNSKINFNRTKNKGVFIYMPGMAEKFGRFGALCIGYSNEEAKRTYAKLIKLVNSNIETLKIV